MVVMLLFVIISMPVSGADPDRVYRFQKPGQIIREKLPSTKT